MSTDAAAETLLRPIRSGNAFEETVERLLQMIRLGVYTPGDSLLPERELARRLGVSRDTVREAISSLVQAGYLVTVRGRYGGTFLADSEAPRPAPTPLPEVADIEDLLNVREVLEVGAVSLASRRSHGDIARDGLWQRFDDVRRASPTDYRRLDSRLHLAFAELTSAPSLTALVADNRMKVNRLLDQFPLLERNIEHSNEQHREIVTAILDGDEAHAAQVMAEHLSGTSALLRGFFSTGTS